MKRKRIIIIAGPNGAGKTTFARRFLPKYARIALFANADEIARGLAHFAPETAAAQAGRILLKTLDGYAAAGLDFAFETTLAGRAYLNKIRAWQNAGYSGDIVFPYATLNPLRHRQGRTTRQTRRSQYPGQGSEKAIHERLAES
jgi:predicted ABC-type ATPase